MVKPNTQNKLSAANTHPIGPQAISSSTGEFPDLLNVISYTSSRAGKCIYPRGHLYTYCTVKHFFRSISATEDSRKVSPEPFSTSEEEKSNKKEVSSGPRMPTASRVTTNKLSYRVASFQLSVALSPSAPEGRTHSMSWNDQVISEESRNIASRVVSAPQAPISTSLMPHGTNYGIAESLS